jgi:hypothetical protein
MAHAMEAQMPWAAVTLQSFSSPSSLPKRRAGAQKQGSKCKINLGLSGWEPSRYYEQKDMKGLQIKKKCSD